MELVIGDYSKIKEYLKKVMDTADFEFKLPYVDENSTFKEIDRFIDESKAHARFKNKYEGDVAIEITDWAYKPINEYFEAFSYFLRDRMLEFANKKVILTCEKECTKEFLAELEDCFETKIEVTDLGLKRGNRFRQTIGFVSEKTKSEYKELYMED